MKNIIKIAGFAAVTLSILSCATTKNIEVGMTMDETPTQYYRPATPTPPTLQRVQKTQNVVFKDSEVPVFQVTPAKNGEKAIVRIMRNGNEKVAELPAAE